MGPLCHLLSEALNFTSKLKVINSLFFLYRFYCWCNAARKKSFLLLLLKFINKQLKENTCSAWLRWRRDPPWRFIVGARRVSMVIQRRRLVLSGGSAPKNEFLWSSTLKSRIAQFLFSHQTRYGPGREPFYSRVIIIKSSHAWIKLNP